MEYRDEVYFKSAPENEAPFSADEFADRLRRLREKMAVERVDMLYLMAPESMYYLSGYQAGWYQGQSPRIWSAASAIAVHVDHDRYILFDSEREAILGRIFTRSTDTRYFPRTALRGSPDFIANELRSAGWLNGTVGMEFLSNRPNRVVGGELEASFRAAGARDVVDATRLLREVRWIKSAAEMECLKEASRIADIGMTAARNAIADGVTELEVFGEMVRAMSAAGGENAGNTMPVLSGAKTNALHGVPTRRKMWKGEMVLVDLCGVFKRYHINLARTFSVGEPAREVATLTDQISQSMKAISAVLKPNMKVSDLNQTVLDYFKPRGLWESRGWIGGYEMGIAFPPDWVGNFVYDPMDNAEEKRIFPPNTAVNYENQFFMPGHKGQYFAVDSFLFEEEKAAIMSKLSPDLIVV